MTHTWISRRYCPGRHGQSCRLLVARRGKFLLQFADGWKVVTMRGTFRKGTMPAKLKGMYQAELGVSMNQMLKRVLCPDCGAVRICHRGSPYAVCPNGHGKLVKRFTKAEAGNALADALPKAHRVARNKFTIDGYEGLFGYRNGSGRRPVGPGTNVGPDEVLARHVTRTRRLVRVFTRKARNRRAGLLGTDG